MFSPDRVRCPTLIQGMYLSNGDSTMLIPSKFLNKLYSPLGQALLAPGSLVFNPVLEYSPELSKVRYNVFDYRPKVEVLHTQPSGHFNV